MSNKSLVDIDDFVSYLVSNNASPGTIRTNLSALRAIEVFLDGADLTTVTFERFIASRLLAAKTKENQKKLFNGLNVKITAYNNLISYFSSRGVNHSLKKRRHFPKYIPSKRLLSVEEITQLLDTKIEYRRPVGNKFVELAELDFSVNTVLWFLAMTGARIDETLSIRARDLDLFEGSVWLVFTKSGKSRKVFVFEPVLSRLKRLQEGKDGDDLIFANSNGSKISDSWFRKDLKRRATRVGISTKITPHILRHSYGKHLRDKGVKIDLLKELMGHENIQTTIEHYGNYQDDELRRASARHYLNQEGSNPQEKIDYLEGIILEETAGDTKINQSMIREALVVLRGSVI